MINSDTSLLPRINVVSVDQRSLVVEVLGQWSSVIFCETAEPRWEGRNIQFDGAPRIIEVDCRGSSEIDTTGAAVLYAALSRVGTIGNLLPATPEQHEVLQRVFSVSGGEKELLRREGFITFLGSRTIIIAQQLVGVVALLGEVVSVCSKAARSPKRFRLSEVMTQLYSVCLMAVGVVSLVTFLIGVVVAYLFSLQAVRYGANIFVVDGVGQAMLRELSPILVAVVVAGRTGSAFTAQIGAMKMNEELDALEMLGLSTQAVVVVPRIIALVIAMPLLVFIGDIVGMVGAAAIAQAQLAITPSFFIDRFAKVIPLKAYLIGLGKAPIFGLVVGLIACSLGLSVERNAQSLGLCTTSTVVQSIVAVIVLNALFAVLCARAGW
jgi:phospholipid/cholesterol/gamma-HCH transport system permease protein